MWQSQCGALVPHRRCCPIQACQCKSCGNLCNPNSLPCPALSCCPQYHPHNHHHHHCQPPCVQRELYVQQILVPARTSTERQPPKPICCPKKKKCCPKKKKCCSVSTSPAEPQSIDCSTSMTAPPGCKCKSTCNCTQTGGTSADASTNCSCQNRARKLQVGESVLAAEGSPHSTRSRRSQSKGSESTRRWRSFDPAHKQSHANADADCIMPPASRKYSAANGCQPKEESCESCEPKCKPKPKPKPEPCCPPCCAPLINIEIHPQGKCCPPQCCPPQEDCGDMADTESTCDSDPCCEDEEEPQRRSICGPQRQSEGGHQRQSEGGYQRRSSFGHQRQSAGGHQWRLIEERQQEQQQRRRPVDRGPSYDQPYEQLFQPAYGQQAYEQQWQSIRAQPRSWEQPIDRSMRGPPRQTADYEDQRQRWYEPPPPMKYDQPWQPMRDELRQSTRDPPYCPPSGRQPQQQQQRPQQRPPRQDPYPPQQQFGRPNDSVSLMLDESEAEDNAASVLSASPQGLDSDCDCESERQRQRAGRSGRVISASRLNEPHYNVGIRLASSGTLVKRSNLDLDRLDGQRSQQSDTRRVSFHYCNDEEPPASVDEQLVLPDIGFHRLGAGATDPPAHDRKMVHAVHPFVNVVTLCHGAWDSSTSHTAV